MSHIRLDTSYTVISSRFSSQQSNKLHTPLFRRHNTNRGLSTVVPRAAKLADAPAFGPKGLLLIGFLSEEAAAVAAWLQPAGLAVSCCPANKYKTATIGQVILNESTKHGGSIVVHPWEDIPDAPKVCILCGLSGQEVIGRKKKNVSLVSMYRHSC